jgi:hypothetical protein
MICRYSCSVKARQVSDVMLPFDVTERIKPGVHPGYRTLTKRAESAERLRLHTNSDGDLMESTNLMDRIDSPGHQVAGRLRGHESTGNH